MMELDGRPVTAEELAPLALTNYGHFTSMTVQDMAVRGLSMHLERLRHDCNVLFSRQLDSERVRSLVRRAVEKESSSLIVARVTVYDPEIGLGNIGNDVAPKILVTTRAASGLTLPPLTVNTARYTRSIPAVKHVGLLESMYLRRKAQRSDYGDVLFVDDKGFITEGATWNLGVATSTEILWPEGDQLEGVTKRLLTTACEERGIRVRTGSITADGLHQFPLTFATNVSFGVRPISSVNGNPLPGSAALLDSLREAYLSIPGEKL